MAKVVQVVELTFTHRLNPDRLQLIAQVETGNQLKQILADSRVRQHRPQRILTPEGKQLAVGCRETEFLLVQITLALAGKSFARRVNTNDSSANGDLLVVFSRSRGLLRNYFAVSVAA